MHYLIPLGLLGAAVILIVCLMIARGIDDDGWLRRLLAHLRPRLKKLKIGLLQPIQKGQRKALREQEERMSGQ